MRFINTSTFALPAFSLPAFSSFAQNALVRARPDRAAVHADNLQQWTRVTAYQHRAGAAGHHALSAQHACVSHQPDAFQWRALSECARQYARRLGVN